MLDRLPCSCYFLWFGIRAFSVDKQGPGGDANHGTAQASHITLKIKYYKYALSNLPVSLLDIMQTREGLFLARNYNGKRIFLEEDRQNEALIQFVTEYAASLKRYIIVQNIMMALIVLNSVLFLLFLLYETTVWSIWDNGFFHVELGLIFISTIIFASFGCNGECDRRSSMAMIDTLYAEFLDLTKSSHFVGVYSLHRLSPQHFVACGFLEFNKAMEGEFPQVLLPTREKILREFCDILEKIKGKAEKPEEIATYIRLLRQFLKLPFSESSQVLSICEDCEGYGCEKCNYSGWETREEDNDVLEDLIVILQGQYEEILDVFDLQAFLEGWIIEEIDKQSTKPLFEIGGCETW